MFRLYVLLVLSIILEICAVEAANSNTTTSIEESESFKTKITPYCDTTPGKLVITGDEVKFSEIVKPDGIFDIPCGNSSGNVTVVYIFAWRKIYVDQNINAPGFDFFAFAPTWQVVSISVINLKGRGGEFMPMPEPSEMGRDGKDGSPGNPGEPGGNFYGVGETFVDGQYLSIDVSGGDGGPGQDGGVGGGGTNGRHALKTNLSLTCSHSACDGSGTMKITALDDKHEYTDFKCKEEYNYIIYDMFFLPPVAGNVRQCSYYIYGADGTTAGIGGDGGVGGKGGYPGHIFLLELTERSQISRVDHLGKPGIDGRGNQGGLWSETGWDVSFKKRESYSNESPHIRGTASIRYIDSHRYVRLDKTLGVDGGNSRYLIEPVLGKTLDFPVIHLVMAEYTKFVNSHTKAH